MSRGKSVLLSRESSDVLNDSGLVLVVDSVGNVLAANDRVSEVFHYSQNELLGLNVSLVFRASENDALIRSMISGGQVWHGEVCCHSRYESAICLLATIIPYFDNSTKCISHYLITATDITHYKHAYESMVTWQQVKIMRRWVSGIAHEIRNPLATIRGFLQLMQIKQGETARFLSVVLSEVDRVTAILTEVLSIGKPQLDADSYVDTERVLGAMGPLLQAQAVLRDVNITIATEPDLPKVTCFEHEMKQIILNVVNNAIEAMPRGGVCEIVVERQGADQVVLRCSDTGIGIPQALLYQIANPFVTSKKDGTGLGLSICQSILASHGGHLRIRSQEGMGTTVEVVFTVFS